MQNILKMVKDVSVLLRYFSKESECSVAWTQVGMHYYVPEGRDCCGQTGKRRLAGTRMERVEDILGGWRRSEPTFTRNPEEFFLASAFSRVAFNAGFVFL